jgi:hypothetical protein
MVVNPQWQQMCNADQDLLLEEARPTSNLSRQGSHLFEYEALYDLRGK